MSEKTTANSASRLIVPALSVLALLAAVALTWWVAGGGSDEQTVENTNVPARVQQTLAKIDAGEWPPADAPGTSGGRTFRNNEGLLPATGAYGQPLRFQEWDVNRKKSGQGRDAERIITANDGSAWYTLDHYRTFIQIRGPSHD